MNDVINEKGSDAGMALRTIHETQAAAAARAKAPGWYHPTVGGILGVMIAALDMEDYTAVIAVACCALAVAISEAQERTGIWMTGLNGGRRSYGLITLAVFVIVGGIGVGYAMKQRGVDGAMVVAGVAIGLFATWFGYRIERALLRDAQVRR